MINEQGKGHDNTLIRYVSEMNSVKIEHIVELRESGKIEEAQQEIENLKPLVGLEQDLLIDEDQRKLNEDA